MHRLLPSLQDLNYKFCSHQISFAAAFDGLLAELEKLGPWTGLLF